MTALWFWEDDIFPTWWAWDDTGIVVMWGETYEYDPREREKD
jgi:hypothetical protein